MLLKLVPLLCLLVLCESHRYDRFGHHGHGGHHGGHHGRHHGDVQQPHEPQTIEEFDTRYDLLDSDEDLDSGSDSDSNDSDTDDDSNESDITSRRYANGRYYHHGRRRGHHRGMRRNGRFRNHFQRRRLRDRDFVKRQVMDSDEDLTDALTSDGQGQQPPRSRNWRRRFGLQNPWLASLGLGVGDGQVGGWDTMPFNGRGRQFNFRFGHHNLNMGFFGSISSIFSDGSSKPTHWTLGENVCKSVVTDIQPPTHGYAGTIWSRSCEENITAYTCTIKQVDNTQRNTTIVTKRCCPGFTRHAGDDGCTRPLNLHNMTELVKKLDVGEFVKALDDSQLSFALTAPNMTVFVPTNEALSSYQPDSVDLSNYIVLSSQEQEEIVNEGQRLLEGHLVESAVLSTDDMADNQVLETLHPESKIRINKYANKVVTANCAKIINRNNFAKTGIVHVVDDVIIQEPGTIYDFIQQNKDLSMFFDALSNTSLAAELRKADATYTVFAPSNTAFQKLKPEVRRRLLGDGDGSCMNNVLSAHVVDKIWCAAGMVNGTAAKNLLKQPLLFVRDQEENLSVNGILVITDNYVTENGVVHIINDIMATSAVVMDLAEDNGATHIVSLFNAANMMGHVNDLENVTLFLPTDIALETISAGEIDALRANDEKLRELLNFHIVNGTYTSGNLRNGNHLTTQADASLTVTETVVRAVKRKRFRDRTTFRPMKNIQCASIVRKDLFTCSGKTVVHLIDKVLLPPVGSILDVMKQDEPTYSTFLGMVRRAQLTNLLGFRNQSDLTLFLPTNAALENMPQPLRTRLSDTTYLKNFVKNHIVNASICCSSARTEYWGDSVGLRTLTGNVIPWRQDDFTDDVQIGRSPLQVCDIAATNGIVHVIDGFLPHRRLGTDMFDFDDLFDWFD